MYTTDFAYDRPIFVIPLSLSYPSSPVFDYLLSMFIVHRKLELQTMLILILESRQQSLSHLGKMSVCSGLEKGCPYNDELF